MKAKILVIEDEAAINDMICMGLEATGYETEAFLTVHWQVRPL